MPGPIWSSICVYVRRHWVRRASVQHNILKHGWGVSLLAPRVWPHARTQHARTHARTHGRANVNREGRVYACGRRAGRQSRDCESVRTCATGTTPVTRPAVGGRADDAARCAHAPHAAPPQRAHAPLRAVGTPQHRLRPRPPLHARRDWLRAARPRVGRAREQQGAATDPSTRCRPCRTTTNLRSPSRAAAPARAQTGARPR